MRQDNNPFADWFWQVVWLVGDYTLEELPDILFELVCKQADPAFQGYYVQDILDTGDSKIFVYRPRNIGIA